MFVFAILPSGLTGFDQLQNLRAKTASPSLAIQGLQNKPRRCGDVPSISALPGLAIADLCPLKQVMTLGPVHGGSRAMMGLMGWWGCSRGKKGGHEKRVVAMVDPETKGASAKRWPFSTHLPTSTQY